eukprot:gene35205-41499_t
MTIYDSGVNIGGGLTLWDSGLVISQGNLEVATGGLITYQGLTINSGGLVSSGGFTVANGDLYFNGALTVNNGGVNVFNGLTVETGGFIANGGVTIYDGGLQVFGGMTVFGEVYLKESPTIFSDERLKTNIVQLEKSLMKVSKLRGVYYSWIQDEPSGLSFDTQRHVGVLAQEVEAVLPEAVSEMYDGKYLGVRYEEIIPLLVEAIKELDEKLTATNSRKLSPEDVQLSSSDSSYLNATQNSDNNSQNSSSGKCGKIGSGIAQLREKLQAMEVRQQDLIERVSNALP